MVDLAFQTTQQTRRKRYISISQPVLSDGGARSKRAVKQASIPTLLAGGLWPALTHPYKHGSRRDLWISSNSHQGKSSASHVVPPQRRVDRSVGADRGGAPRPHKEVRDRHRHRRRRRLPEALRRLAAAEHRAPRAAKSNRKDWLYAGAPRARMVRCGLRCGAPPAVPCRGTPLAGSPLGRSVLRERRG